MAGSRPASIPAPRSRRRPAGRLARRPGVDPRARRRGARRRLGRADSRRGVRGAGMAGAAAIAGAGTAVARRAPTAGGLVGRADLVCVSRHDVGPEIPAEELARFLRPGAWLAITDGAEGGLVAEATSGGLGRVVGYRAIAAHRELDPTGAGDTFLAALVARAMSPGEQEHRKGRGAPGNGHPRWAKCPTSGSPPPQPRSRWRSRAWPGCRPAPPCSGGWGIPPLSPSRTRRPRRCSRRTLHGSRHSPGPARRTRPRSRSGSSRPPRWRR